MKKSSNSTIKTQEIIENYILVSKIRIKVDLNNCKVIFEDDHFIFNDNPQEQQFTNNNSVDEIEKVNSTAHYMQCLTKDGKVLKAYECGICSKIFTQSCDFIKHLFVHTKKRNYICTECGNGFCQRSILKQHRVIHSSERPHVCEICNKNFNRISTLISHRKIHSDTKSYICPICSRGFHQKGNLKNHIYTHTGQKPYKCTLCEKGYNQKSNLVFHMKKWHSCGRIWKCEQCNIEFPKRALLRAHEIEKYNKNNQINLCETMTNQNANSPSSSHTYTDNEFQLDNPGLCIDAIDTDEMQRARQNGDIPLAILHLLQGDTIIVKVTDYGNMSLLESIHGMDYNFEASSTSIEQSGTRFTIVASIHQIVDENGQSKIEIYEPNNNYIINSLEEINNEEVSTIQPININFSHLNFPESIENKENNGNALNSNNSNINNNQQIEQIQEHKQQQPRAIALQNDLNFNCLTPITSNCNADSTRNAFQNIATNGYLTPTNICEDENSRNSSHSINLNNVFDDFNLNDILNGINFENNIDKIQ